MVSSKKRQVSRYVLGYMSRGGRIIRWQFRESAKRERGWGKMIDFTSEDFTVLFVYGTLRSGEGRHHVVEDSVVFKDNLLLEGYVMYDDGRGYPLLVEGGSDDAVEGELFVIKDPDGSILRRIDRIEGADEHVSLGQRLYRRERVEVRPGTFAWVYIYNQPLGDAAVAIRNWVKRNS